MYKVMLADDSEATQRIVTLAFKDSDCRVVCFSDGIDVLDYVSHSAVDILLIDVALPGIDGYQLCQILQGNDNTAGKPIILMGSIRRPVDYERSRKMKVSAILEKPFETIQLEELVRNLLASFSDGLSDRVDSPEAMIPRQTQKNDSLPPPGAAPAASLVDLSGLAPENLGARTRVLPRRFVDFPEKVAAEPSGREVAADRSKRLSEEDYSRVVTLAMERISAELESVIPDAVDRIIKEKQGDSGE